MSVIIAAFIVITQAVQSPSTGPPAAAAPAQSTVTDQPSSSFHNLLHMLNPLQYLPGVGTIYRAVTGDVIPDAVRAFGSILVGGLLGGPIGMIVSIATTLAEKITGIDPEKIITAEFHPAPKAAPSPADPAAPANAPSDSAPASVQTDTVRTNAQADPVPTKIPALAVDPVSSAPIQVAWTPQQLAAYGVRQDRSNNLKLADVTGADVLNGLELLRLGQAAAAYASTQAMSPAAGAARSG